MTASWLKSVPRFVQLFGQFASRIICDEIEGVSLLAHAREHILAHNDVHRQQRILFRV